MLQKKNEVLLYETMLANIDDSFNSERIKASIKMDLLILYMANLITRAGSLFQPYNPNTSKKKNDGIDMQLLHTLMLPARICSKDGLSTPRTLGSFQAKWILKPEELVSMRQQDGKLEPLSWV